MNLNLSVTNYNGVGGAVVLAGHWYHHQVDSVMVVTELICDKVDDKYRFGFNTQEKVNEWAGMGNHNTALYWEYDTRIGRRLNLEPEQEHFPWLSPYVTERDNPIVISDKNGDCPFCIIVILGGLLMNSEVANAPSTHPTADDIKRTKEAHENYNINLLNAIIPIGTIDGTLGKTLIKRAAQEEIKNSAKKQISKEAKRQVENFVDNLENKTERNVSNVSKPYSRSRPSHQKALPDKVWENAKQEDGKVYDPNTGEELQWDKSKPRKGQWDMGHKPGKEYKKLHSDYMGGKLSKEEFINEHNNPDNYQPESPYSNQSHKFEQK